jgi:signal transduction histidine kinase/ActR/RegA family two-component response regulator
MNFLGVDVADFSGQYLKAALIVSLMSVWMLVGLFYYLNRYTKRDYFTVWTAAWLFYALWLTLGLKFDDAKHLAPDDALFKLRQCCVAVSAVFLLWGSLRFLKIPVRQTLFGLFMLFLLVWTFVGPEIIARASALEMELPVFILLGLSSVFAGVCFFRMRKRMPFVGAGMLATGFFLWGLYLGSYPLTQEKNYTLLASAGFFVAAVLQLFIAVSMIVLVLEEIRYKSEQTMAEITAVRSEKEQLQIKILTTEEKCRNLYDKVRVTDGLQKAYEELRQTQQVVVQQERLRALGQMASGVAHDVNNALSPIVAYSEILLTTQPNMPAETRHYLQIINQAGEDIAKIVARMREFYRRRSEEEPLVEVDINQIIPEVIQLTRPRWRDISQREGICIHMLQDLEPGLPLLSSDASELREALINLVFNAVDALPNGGNITFVTRSLDGSATGKNGEVERQLQIEVRDNGTGMDEKIKQRCLEPFFSTKSLQGGTGLGLAMVYGMMQRHEGNIEIDTAPGQGTCFRLTFPIREKSPHTLPATAPEINHGRSLHILCVDDDEVIRQLIGDCLTHFNHRVVTADSGQQGLEFFRAAAEQKQPFEIVITDLGMPRMDGHQLARTLKTESPHTPIIMMTGWGTMMKEDGETAPEVDAVVGKPPQIQELNALLLRMSATGTATA